MIRRSLLALARSHRVKAWAMALPATRNVVARFVPGETIEECLNAVRTLAEDGLLASIDHLGEDTTSPAQAQSARDAYVDLLRRLGEQGLVGQAEVSVKLTALGLGLPDGVAVALRHARDICATAAHVGTTVTVDMEDRTRTEATLGILEALRADHPGTGGVLQAYLLRTPEDCRRFRLPGARIRLCKGAYAEPAEVAHQTPAAVAAAYRSCLGILMSGPGYPMVATHDPAMIAAALELIGEHGRDPGSYEFQMLYGIRADEQRRLAAAGHRVRVYVPYGTDWWGYFLRRLAERPANLAFFLRALIGA